MRQPKWNRRTFLKTSALGVASVRYTFAQGRAWGVQLYTVRGVLRRDPAGVLRAIADMGYREVELVRSGMSQVVPHLKTLPLNATSGHYEAELVMGDWRANQEQLKDPYYPKDWEAAVDQAASVGLRYMVVSSYRASREAGIDGYKKFAEQMNLASPVCLKAGIRLGYHNHAFEFGPVGGTRPIDVLVKELAPEVGLELDVFWASVAGEDPTTLIRSWGPRVRILHLKDRAPGVSQTVNEREVPGDAFREVGRGMLDFKGILDTAKAVGVEHYFVEQDQCPGNPLDSLRESIRYLQQFA
ncbi:MAG TPA: sugar phosphate isomerase/epimerase [Acidobacteriota bacterium]|nr:sugar phosphate isomerase/epimerase [Acidobacteriota bacterium]